MRGRAFHSNKVTESHAHIHTHTRVRTHQEDEEVHESRAGQPDGRGPRSLPFVRGARSRATPSSSQWDGRWRRSGLRVRVRHRVRATNTRTHTGRIWTLCSLGSIAFLYFHVPYSKTTTDKFKICVNCAVICNIVVMFGAEHELTSRLNKRIFDRMYRSWKQSMFTTIWIVN